jgi:prophage DNA circulation protein
MQITEITNTAWRDGMMPASFRNAEFHVEAATQESGRRIIIHEFPKRDLPYSEDMGRKAVEFTVRGYCIAYPFNTNNILYQRDYRIPRDILITELERDGEGVLQLPHLPPVMVVPQRYRITEERRFGGYCVFDMTFAERGQVLPPGPSTRNTIMDYSFKTQQRTIAVMDGRGMVISARTPAAEPTPPI